ncbi:hypothetical protein AB0O42_05675 [Streptomyces sp. NPDC089922]|uniref:hypothetical protein n=1 Tax=Streptomyces sp. NPDC089922 TaxID=3155189 RepID=UPI00341D3E34
MNLAKALQMLSPFEEMPHYDTAVAQLYVAGSKGKRELHCAAYRIRDAFASYQYAVTYGKADSA